MRKNIIIFLLYVFLSILMTYPLIFCLGTAVPTGPWFHHDAFLNIWILAWVQHTLFSHHLNLFDANIFFPALNTLALSEHLFGNALISLPIRIINANPILHYNFIFMFTLIISGFGCYLLFFYLTGRRFPAFFAGIVFAFISTRFRYIQLIQIQSTHWIPLIFLYFLKFIKEKKTKDAVLFSLFMFLNFITSIYLGLIFMVAFSLILLFFIVFNQKELFKKDIFIKLIPLLILIAIPLTFFYLPYRELYYSQVYTKYEARMEEVLKNSASLISYLEYPSQLTVLRKIAPSVLANEGLFPGMVVCILLFFGIYQLFKIQDIFTRRFFVSLLASGALSFLLSLGLKSYAYRIFLDIIPFLPAIRVPERFSIFLIFVLSIFAGLGFTLIKKKFLMFFVFGLFLIENLIVPIRLTLVTDIIRPAPVYLWLKDQPDDTVVLELPMPSETEEMWLEVKYTINSVHHWKRIANGYSGYFPQVYYKIREEVFKGFPKTETLLFLKNYGIKLIIVHTQYFRQEIWEQLNKYIKESPLIPVMDFGSTKVYKIPDDLK